MEPRVWALQGARTGDNNQVLALAEALGWPFETKPLAYTLLRKVPNRLAGAHAFALTPAARATLVPPWPDLVIGVGYRSVPVARWIRAQSGGRARTVQIGWPRIDPRALDAVITTVNYPVPPAPNVLTLPVVLSRVTAARLAEAADLWRPLTGHYPLPWSVLLIGGASWPLHVTPGDAAHAVAALAARAGARGGSVIASSSRRTPPGVVAAARAALAAAGVPGTLLTPDAPDGNPYLGLLALAADITVTADSTAMLSDAIAAGRPVGLAPTAMRSGGRAVLRSLRALRPAEGGTRTPGDALKAWGLRAGLTDWRRDVPLLSERLLAAGLVGPLDAPHAAAAPGAVDAARWLRDRLGL